MNIEKLTKEIEECFPFVEKPNGAALSFHETDCFECDDLRSDLESYIDKEIPPEAIRKMYHEMSMLSAEGWCWALPSYLRFCLTEKAVYNQDEIEFLIYNFGPSEEFQADTKNRLSGFNRKQIECILSFLNWCNEPSHWASSYCGNNILMAIEFVTKLKE